MSLTWECLDAEFAHRAPAPLFGTIRVERRHTQGPWEINWSVPGHSAKLIEGEWPDAETAMRAAEAHVASVCARHTA